MRCECVQSGSARKVWLTRDVVGRHGRENGNAYDTDNTDARCREPLELALASALAMGKTHEPPSKNIPDMASFCHLETRRCHTTGNGRVRRTTSIKMLMVEVATRKSLKLMQWPSMDLLKA